MIPRLCANSLERMRQHFATLYGPDQATRCLERLAATIGRYGVGMLEAAPSSSYRADDIVLITYADILRAQAAPPPVVLRQFLNAYLRGAVNTVHLLPFFPWSSDDGFAVTDYRSIQPDCGAWNDIEVLGSDFRLMFDLVLNHVSRQSGWFTDYLKGIAPARHYFIEADPAQDLSAVVRPRTSPLLTAVRTKSGKRHVWTTFSADQIDLNFACPDLLFEFIDILLLYVSKGARILRLDAIAYLWKTIGTDCLHRPQTHVIVKLLRELLDMVAPATRLLTETNVPHEENISYFGQGDEAHMVYQFPLPPLLLHCLHAQDASALTRWAAALQPPPPGCAYLNFTASHDGIGVRPLHGLVSEEAIQALAARIKERGGQISFKQNADGTASPYEFNITYLDALSEPGGGDRDGDRRRFLTSQAIMLALQGIPAVYFHSLCGTRNDTDGVSHSGIARRINRRKFIAADLIAQIEDPGSEANAIFTAYRRMLHIRAAQPAFAPQASQKILNLHPACFGLRRESADPAQTLICVSNVSGQPRPLKLTGQLSDLRIHPHWHDLLSDKAWQPHDGRLTLAPWQTVWLNAADPQT